jgi:hypothetical protein
MRMGKRTLAGVAAGALGLSLIPFVAVATATSANAATGTATVSPVRVSFTGSTQDAVPNARASFNLAMGGTVGAALTVAPAGGKLVSDDTDITLAAAGSNLVVRTADDSYINLKAVGAAGRYAGSIYDGTDTVTFDFTTSGAPASMTLTPATQTVLVGAVATTTVSILDAAGNPTQPGANDSVTVTSNTDDTVGTGTLTSDLLFAGVYDDTLATAGNPAGNTTVTATPLGTLPSQGLTTRTATVTKSGTISSAVVVGYNVTTPATGVFNSGGANATAQVAEGTSSITITVDDTTVNPAGTKLRFSAEVANGSINGTPAASSPVYVDVTTDAAKKATMTLTLAGGALLAGQSVTVKQVDVLDTPVSGSQIVVTQTAAAVTADTVTATPSGDAVAAIGATTNVAISADDSLGAPQAGLVVRAYRGSVSAANLLSQATTASNGQAALTVTSAAGAVDNTSETYAFTFQQGAAAEVTITDALTIVYTTSGNITTLSVAPSTGTAFDAAGATVTTLPVITVPNTTGVVDGAASAGVYTLASSSVTTAPTTSLVTFAITTTPGNPSTVTVPEGMRVSATDPNTTDTQWNGGAQSATISSAGTAYVWATKVGTHTVTITSGGLTATGQVVVTNSSNDAYNIALTPAEQRVDRGAIATATLTVTDVFGNPVQTTDDTGAVTITASGQILLAGFVLVQETVKTAADGTATITMIAGNADGQGLLTAVPKAGNTAPAWQSGFDAPVDAPAPVTSATAEIGVGEAPIEASILIEGSRENRRINVDGLTTGLPAGTVVKPWLRFPGQTGFTEGAAQRSVQIVDEDLQIGEFSWGRNTGKRTAVQFRDADGLRSNSIIIAAR